MVTFADLSVIFPTESANNQKLMLEYEKFQEMQSKMMKMQEEYERQLIEKEEIVRGFLFINYLFAFDFFKFYMSVLLGRGGGVISHDILYFLSDFYMQSSS